MEKPACLPPPPSLVLRLLLNGVILGVRRSVQGMHEDWIALLGDELTSSHPRRSASQEWLCFPLCKESVWGRWQLAGRPKECPMPREGWLRKQRTGREVGMSGFVAKGVLFNLRLRVLKELWKCSKLSPATSITMYHIPGLYLLSNGNKYWLQGLRCLHLRSIGLAWKSG